MSAGHRKAPPPLLEQLREDLAAHRGDWTRPGFRAVAVHRFGRWRRRFTHRWQRAPFALLYRLLYLHCRNVYGIEIPESAYLGRRVIVEHQHGIVVHGSSVIGDDCILRQGVTLGNRSLEHPADAPILGRRVNIGAGAKILGRVRIGDDASIGANAVVLHDVPPRTTVIGIPARPCRDSTPEPGA